MEGEASRKLRRTRIRKIGPYLLVRPIGKGSFSTVYEGKIENSSKKVAVKVISLVNVRKKDYQRVQMQVKILSLIKHENIVELLDFKKSARHLYLIFEHCQNTDLEKHLNKYYSGIMPEHIARRVFLQIKKAFQILRLHRIVHRDLKLANILVTEDFRIKIADFGFAGLLEDNMLFSSCVGTPLTMAPEVLDRKDYGQKCDIWSLGIILYQMLQGATPFVQPDNMTLQALREGILTRKIVFNPKIPLSEEVKGLILRMVVNDPQQRMSFEDFFRHDWLREEAASTGLCLREVVLQKEFSKHLGSPRSLSQQETEEIARNMDRTVLHKLLSQYRSSLENRLYSYIGLSKRLLSWRRLEQPSGACQRPILMALVVLASNIKTAEECQGVLVVNSTKVKMAAYNQLKEVELASESEFSRSLSLLLKKSKTALREQLNMVRKDISALPGMSLAELYITSVVEYVAEGCPSSEVLQSLLKVKLHDQLTRVFLGSQVIPKEVMNVVAAPQVLTRLACPRLQKLDPQFIRIYKLSNSLLKVQPRTSSDPDKQKLDQLYDYIRELM